MENERMCSCAAHQFNSLSLPEACHELLRNNRERIKFILLLKKVFKSLVCSMWHQRGGKNTGWQNRNTCFNNSNEQYYHWLNFQVLFSWSSPSSLVRWSCWNLCTSCLFCQILILGSFFTRPSVRCASMISERQERQHQLCFYQMLEPFSSTTEWLPTVTVENK